MDTSPAFSPQTAVRLGRRIRARRESLDLTQTRLADLVGTRQPTISKWERGDLVPSTRHLIALRQCLGLDDAEFLRWMEDAA